MKLTYNNYKIIFNGSNIVYYSEEVEPAYITLLNDGSTFAWYNNDSSSASMTIIDSSVSLWKDILNSGRNLVQSVSERQPKWTSNGILFDGVDDHMAVTSTLIQPESIYMVLNPISWTSGDRILNGIGNDTGAIYQSGSSPLLALYAGAGIASASATLNQIGIIRAIINSTNSKIQYNNITPVSGNVGTRNMGGLFVGGNTAGTNNSNIQVKEIIVRRVIDTSANENLLYNYLRVKYMQQIPSNSPSVLVDGSTVGWYVADNSTTMTFSQDASISVWRDTLGYGTDLIQASGTAQPQWTSNGVLFDGVNDYMKTVQFTLNQPEQIYIVFKQITWTTTDTIFDGYALNTGRLFQITATPGLSAQAPVSLPVPINELVLNTFGIVRVLFNRANSKFQINNNSATTWDCSVNNMGGFTLGARGSNLLPSNIQVKEVIIRNVSDNSTDETTIYNYLREKYMQIQIPANSPSILVDGNTAGWYVADISSSMTFSQDTSISVWKDVLGYGTELSQTAGSKQPQWTSDGVLFNGSTNTMATINFQLAQPFCYYIVINQLSYTQYDKIFDGLTTNYCTIQQTPTPPNLLFYANGTTTNVEGPPLGQWSILRCNFNDTSSFFKADASTTLTPNVGTANPGGLRLGSRTGADVQFCNMQIKEIVIRKTADTSINENIIYTYLKNKYSL